MDKIFHILQDIAIVIVLMSLSYIFINFQSIKTYTSAIMNSNGKYISIEEKEKIKEAKNKDIEEKNKRKVLFLYNNSNEVKRSKENNLYNGNNIVKSLNYNTDSMILVTKDNNSLIEAELKKKRLELLKQQELENKNKTFSNTKVETDDFFSLSQNLTSEEELKYGKDSYVVIPKLNIEAPIFYPNIEEQDLEKHILKLLEKGVVHRPETQLPYQKGNFFILGHSSNYARVASEYNNIFAKIDLLSLGDKVYIYYKGRKYTYELSEKKIVDNSAIEVYGYIPGYNLSIMTCWPIGSVKNRLIAIFTLQKNIN